MLDGNAVLTRAADAAHADANDGRPAVAIRKGELDKVADDAERALVASGRPVYQRGKFLVRPATVEVPAAHAAGKPRGTVATCLVALEVPGVMDELAKAARWTRFDARSLRDVPADPPEKVARILASRFGSWTVPSIAGTITCPTIRPDGSILATPGYDLATRLYLAVEAGFALPPMPARPTRADAARALGTLEALLTEFPFRDPAPGSVDRAVSLSGLMTPVCRGAIEVAPLHAIRAPTAGTGKTYAVNLASAIVSGGPCPVSAMPAGKGHGEEELEKRIAGLLFGGYAVAAIDNLNGELGGDLLCQATERPIVRLRRLGGSDMFDVECRTTLYATGNNMTVRGDMTRRTLIADLEAAMERPELRRFERDPMTTVLADRGTYVAAVLTIARAYLLSGDRVAVPPIASYGGWSRFVREPLVWLGLGDPVASMETARRDDPELSALRAVMGAWHGAIGPDRAIALRDAIKLADARRPDPDYGHATQEHMHPALREALTAVSATSGVDGISPLRLGKWFSARKGRPARIEAGTFAFVEAGLKDSVQQWNLERR